MNRFALLLPAALLACATSAGAHGQRTDQTGAAQLRTDMRKLWEDHVTYTAFFYKAAINGGDDAGKIAERLLRNQDDIGNAVKPFYGEDAGNKLWQRSTTTPQPPSRPTTRGTSICSWSRMSWHRAS